MGDGAWARRGRHGFTARYGDPRSPPHRSKADRRPALTVLSGFWPEATLAVARTLLADDPTLLVIRHDLAGVRARHVRRIVRTGHHRPGGLGSRPGPRLHLVHPARGRSAHPGPAGPSPSRPGSGPGATGSGGAGRVGPGLRVGSRRWCSGRRRGAGRLVRDRRSTPNGRWPTSTTTDDLIGREMPPREDDHRAVAGVVVRQIEYADTHHPLWTIAGRARSHRPVVGAGAPVGPVGDPVQRRRSGPGLPPTPYRPSSAPGARGAGPAAWRGLAVAEPDPVAELGVLSTVFRARRPFHPQRLHRAFESITADVVRCAVTCGSPPSRPPRCPGNPPAGRRRDGAPRRVAGHPPRKVGGRRPANNAGWPRRWNGTPTTATATPTWSSSGSTSIRSG